MSGSVRLSPIRTAIRRVLRQRYGAPIVNCSAEELRSALARSPPTAGSLDAEALNRIEDAHSLTLVTERLRHRLTEPKTTPLVLVQCQHRFSGTSGRQHYLAAGQSTHLAMVEQTADSFFANDTQ